MKKVVLSLVVLGLSAQAFAQDVLYSAKIKEEDVPEVIIEAVERDYPDFTIEEYAAIPIEYVESDVYVNRSIDSVDDYDTFDITLEGKGKEFTATYNKYGDLISTSEHLKNIAPPAAVRNAVAKSYPGWTIEKDVYNMKSYGNGKARERYRMELTKGNEKMHVYTNANGKILNRPKMKKMGK
ncbi:hypothetical protein [Pareuzebyella sediminis]|uniref:hypothetical protein n=1 Tax=Pareuzebyella sediminis TaxID=2607998 RepID=UPI0011EF88CC|nr:hypothetical protein [Pareuzebyella sediminis]